MDVLLVGVGGARELSTAMWARPRAARDGSQLRRPTACRAPRGRTRAHPPTAIRGAAGAGSHAGPRVRGWRLGLGAWGHVASGEVTRGRCLVCVFLRLTAPDKCSFPLRFYRTFESCGHAAAVGRARARRPRLLAPRSPHRGSAARWPVVSHHYLSSAHDARAPRRRDETPFVYLAQMTRKDSPGVHDTPTSANRPHRCSKSS